MQDKIRTGMEDMANRYHCRRNFTILKILKNEIAFIWESMFRNEEFKLHTLPSLDPIGLLAIFGLNASGFLSRIALTASFLASSCIILL